MNLKYYLRGLGIGIIVTAVIMGAASGERKETLSDAQIKARAAELGMIEQSGVLADLEENTNLEENAKEPAVSAAPTATPETEKETEAAAAASPDTEREAEATAMPDAETEAEAAATASPDTETEEEAAAMPDTETETAATPEPQKEAGEAVIIEIKAGEGSYTVCQKLEEAGLIASASSFDTYLYQKGYDKKLRIGTYEIPGDAEPEAIAEILAFGG